MPVKDILGTRYRSRFCSCCTHYKEGKCGNEKSKCYQQHKNPWNSCKQFKKHLGYVW